MGSSSRPTIPDTTSMMMSSLRNNLVLFICIIFMSSWNKIKVQSNPVEHIEDVKTDIPEYVDEVDVANDEEQVEDDSNNEEKDIIPEVEDLMEEETKKAGLFRRFAKTFFSQNV